MKGTYRNWPAQCLIRPQAIPGYTLVTNLAPAGLITARICLRAVTDSHTPERIPSQNSLRVWPAQFRSRRPGAILKPFWTPSRSRPTSLIALRTSLQGPAFRHPFQAELATVRSAAKKKGFFLLQDLFY